MNRHPHVLVLGTLPGWLAAQRGPMIRDFLARGCRVTAVGSFEDDETRDILKSWGVDYLVLPIRRAGLNPIADLVTFYKMFRLFRRLTPDIVFAYTVKPIVYGMPAAWLAGVAGRFSMVTGRGYAFQPGREFKRRMSLFLARTLYRFSLRFTTGVIFHNEDDLAMFVDNGLVGAATPLKRIWGSGIDIEAFEPTPLPPGPMSFLMVSRLLKDKGVYEFLDAARAVKARHGGAEFRLAGPTDPSPNGLTLEDVQHWAASGVIEYLGSLKDVRPQIARSHVVVLPSYGEGLPRVILEAMAMGRAVITTNVPGCRDTVIGEENGLCVEARDAAALAKAVEYCIAHPEFVERAGKAGARLAADRFDVRDVNREISRFLKLPESRGAIADGSFSGQSHKED